MVYKTGQVTISLGAPRMNSRKMLPSSGHCCLTPLQPQLSALEQGAICTAGHSSPSCFHPWPQCLSHTEVPSKTQVSLHLSPALPPHKPRTPWEQLSESLQWLRRDYDPMWCGPISANSSSSFFFFSFCLGGALPQHMEVLRLGVQSKPQLLATATATPGSSHILSLHHSSWQPQLLNPLSEARDWTHILLNTSWVSLAQCYNRNSTNLSSTTLPLLPSSPATLSQVFFEHSILCSGSSLWTMHFSQKCSSPETYVVALYLTSVIFTQIPQMISFQSGLLSISSLSKIAASPNISATLPNSIVFFSTYHHLTFYVFCLFIGLSISPSSKGRSPRAGFCFCLCFGLGLFWSLLYPQCWKQFLVHNRC